MKMYRVSFLFCLIGLFLSVQGQDIKETINIINNNIKEQLRLYPQEKIYLQNDRSSYICGETIWFRIYLLDALTHAPTHTSRYVYVELINEQSTVVSRVKIKPDENNLYHGYLKTPEDLPGGNYRLRTYTRYMVNQGDDYFYSKSIKIYEPNKIKQKEKIVDGVATDYDVMFFPEGGYLLEGVMCRVAFKSVNNLGEVEDITGDITDSNGTILCNIGTYHNGMGSFSLKPTYGEKYFLNCKNKNGKNKSFELPRSVQNHYSLSIRNTNDSCIYVSVLKSASVKNPSSLILLMHTGGLIQYLRNIEDVNKSLIFNKKDFPSGVMQVLLLDEKKNPLSERLVFIQNNDNVKLNLTTNKNKYTVRDKVSLNTNIKGNNDRLLNGSYSISVIDGKDLKPDTTSTILTTMLLTSELRGQIENPGFYFEGDNRKAKTALDILMMIHGWRRYNIYETIKGNYQMPSIQPEQSQSITGFAFQEGVLRDKKLKSGKVAFFVPDIGFVKETEIDQNGSFIFDSFELPDSLKYFVQGLTHKNGDRMVLTLDDENFPTIDKYIFPNLKQAGIYTQVDNSDYIGKADKKYTLENGIRITQLKAVEVIAEPKVQKSVYAKDARYSFDSKFIERNNIFDVNSLMRRIPGVQVESGKIYFRGNLATIVVDDVVVSQGIDGFGLSDIVHIADIESIDIVSSQSSVLLGAGGIGGAIVVTTKRGQTKTWEYERKNIKTFIPLGYQTPIEFYSPIYETKKQKEDSKPDFRSLIYWKPDVLINKGESEINFYTADYNTEYYIVIEGVGSNGELIYAVNKIIVDD